MKKEAKMGHNKGPADAGRKKPVTCGQCSHEMTWVKVIRRMKWFCTNCFNVRER